MSYEAQLPRRALEQKKSRSVVLQPCEQCRQLQKTPSLTLTWVRSWCWPSETLWGTEELCGAAQACLPALNNAQKEWWWEWRVGSQGLSMPARIGKARKLNTAELLIAGRHRSSVASYQTYSVISETFTYHLYPTHAGSWSRYGSLSLASAHFSSLMTRGVQTTSSDEGSQI